VRCCSAHAQLVPLTTKASTQQITLPCMLPQPCAEAPAEISCSRSKGGTRISTWLASLGLCPGSVRSAWLRAIAHRLEDFSSCTPAPLHFRLVLRWCVRAPPRPALLQLPSPRPALSACLAKSCVGVSLDAPASPSDQAVSRDRPCCWRPRTAARSKLRRCSRAAWTRRSQPPKRAAVADTCTPREWPCGPWPHGPLSTPAGARKQRGSGAAARSINTSLAAPPGGPALAAPAQRLQSRRARGAARPQGGPARRARRASAGPARARVPGRAWSGGRAERGGTGGCRARTARAAAARAGRRTDGRSAGASTPCCRALPRERPPPRQPRGAVARGWSRRGGPRGAHLGCALAQQIDGLGSTYMPALSLNN